MIDHLRILILMTRPPVMVLLGLFAATGLAQAGRGNHPLLLFETLVVVSGFLLFSVVINDLADEAIDRVNLPGDRRRPLAAGISTRRQLAVVGATAGIVALAASTLLHGPAVVVVGAGLASSMAYSLRPVRIADRGALASMLLPAGYVAVPFLVAAWLSAVPSGRTTSCSSPASTWDSSAGSCTRTSGTSGVTPCSGSEPSWSATGGGGRAPSARCAGWRAR